MRDLMTFAALRDFFALFGGTWLVIRFLLWVLVRTDRTVAQLARDWHREWALRLTLRLGEWR